MAPSNALPIHGNEKTMNLNSLVLANIQASPYFKVHLYELKTYHKVIDEIYYKVNHLEPWEKGSRKLAGQTGMCGGVRGVGTGGIVSSAYCLLYKLYTLKLTRKQLIGLCTHSDSSFIRALGLMYIRYTQPPNTFWEWFEPYLDDDEEVDPKAGGGNNMTIGEMSEQLLLKLEWYGTLFPRIPVPIQKDIENRLRFHKEKRSHMAKQARLNNNTTTGSGAVIGGGGATGGAEDWKNNNTNSTNNGGGGGANSREEVSFGEAERQARMAAREAAHKSQANQSRRSPQLGQREASLPAEHRERKTFSKDRTPPPLPASSKSRRDHKSSRSRSRNNRRSGSRSRNARRSTSRSRNVRKSRSGSRSKNIRRSGSRSKNIRRSGSRSRNIRKSRSGSRNIRKSRSRSRKATAKSRSASRKRTKEHKRHRSRTASGGDGETTSRHKSKHKHHHRHHRHHHKHKSGKKKHHHRKDDNDGNDSDDKVNDNNDQEKIVGDKKEDRRSNDEPVIKKSRQSSSPLTNYNNNGRRSHEREKSRDDGEIDDDDNDGDDDDDKVSRKNEQKSSSINSIDKVAASENDFGESCRESL